MVSRSPGRRVDPNRRYQAGDLLDPDTGLGRAEPAKALDPWDSVGPASTTERVKATGPMPLADPEGVTGPEGVDDTASDLWSLPVDAGGLGTGGEDDFVAAWMSAMGGSCDGNGVAVRRAAPGKVPGPCELDVGGGFGGPPGGVGIPQPAPGRPWAGIVLAVGLSLVVGVASLVVIAQLTGRGIGGGATGPAPVGVDDRVVVFGPSAECPTMLVKPKQDGSTSHVPGTCFSVG